MATKTTVTLIDDIDGSVASTTVRFEFEGVAYEIDLSEAHQDELRNSLSKFLASARRVRGRNPSGLSRRSSLGAINLDAVRTWARNNGHTVGDRGRIQASIIDDYKAAHNS
ncbi:Lsr2 family protein [Micrococcales bacterium 31B]|nr:Lsr2 family protein [Micrococcales bacterium 31B]